MKTVSIIWIIIFMATGLVPAAPVLASEDPDTYPADEKLDFDNLPEIEELPPEEPQEAIKIPPKPATTTPPQLLPETRRLPASGQVSSAGRTVNKPVDDDIFMPQPSDENSNDKDAFDKDKTLTETLKESDDESDSPLKGTWVEKLATSNPLSLLTSSDDDEAKKEDRLEDMVKDARNKENTGKSNAAVFDIAGVMLRMSLQQAERTLENRGFRKINARFEIPNFIKWRNEETCRNKGVVGYERIEGCVINLAKKDGHQYLQYMKYAKYDSKEEIEVYFTSNFTENKVYKIVYNSRIADITGNSPKAVYIRNIKVYDFWKKINQKYGRPDNTTTVVWGLGGDKPYLKASSTGHLLLEDPMFREMDYTRMSREDQRFINSDFYNF